MCMTSRDACGDFHAGMAGNQIHQTSSRHVDDYYTLFTTCFCSYTVVSWFIHTHIQVSEIQNLLSVEATVGDMGSPNENSEALFTHDPASGTGKKPFSVQDPRNGINQSVRNHGRVRYIS